MKADHTRKLIGGTAVVLGLWWIWTTVCPLLWDMATGEAWSNEPFSWVVTVTLVPMMAAPGVLALVFGVRLCLAMCLLSLKWVVGAFALFGALLIGGGLRLVLPDLLPERIASSAFLLAGCVVGIPIYMVALRSLLPRLGCERPKLHSLPSRGVLGLLAFQFWGLLSAVFDEYSPIKEGFSHVHEELWHTLGIPVPIVVAYGAYRLAASRLPTPETGRGAPGSTSVPAGP